MMGGDWLANNNPMNWLMGPDFVRNLFGANGDPIAQFGQQENQIAQQYQPWENQGLLANQFLGQQSMQNMMNPTGLEDSISKNFYTSPYQKNLLDQTTQRMNANAANTGMIASPSSQNYLNNQINNMTGQFQNDYIHNGMNTYQMGMGGMNDIAGRGMTALNGEAGLQEQAAIAAMKAQQQNNGLFSNILGGAMGAIGGGMFGGGGGGFF